jgi:hypothetical protein
MPVRSVFAQDHFAASNYDGNTLANRKWKKDGISLRQGIH